MKSRRGQGRVACCPSLSELPPPPPGRAGWPWTEESPRLPDAMPDGSLWPRVSIVTPSYDQAQFIEETIRSVLLQGYPNLEYMIIDGGSTDGSVEVIRKYEPWLAWWVSEKDNGQGDAINKGFTRASGEIVSWLNSDDVYLPGAAAIGVRHLAQHAAAVLVHGPCVMVDDAGCTLYEWGGRFCTTRDLALDDNCIAQPSTFMRRASLHAAGFLDADLQYVMDYALWLRMGMLGELLVVPEILSRFRVHCHSKTGSGMSKFKHEQVQWLERWLSTAPVLSQQDSDEAVHRMHLRAAKAYAEAGDAEAAAQHLTAALRSGVWPFGSAESTAGLIAEAAMGVKTNKLSARSALMVVERALNDAEPRTMCQRIARIVRSRWHMERFFADGCADRAAMVLHFIFAVRDDRRWLANRGVWSTMVEAFLGRRVAAWARRIV